MPGGIRTGAGRKRIKIDLGEVEKLCGFHCTDEEMASFLGVSLRTIARRKNQPAFAAAVGRGRARGCLSLRRYLWGLAAKGNVAAAIFLSKNLLGYRDVVNKELSGPAESAIPLATKPDLSQLTEEELCQLEAIVRKAASRSRT